jgi:hypothetical protein
VAIDESGQESATVEDPGLLVGEPGPQLRGGPDLCDPPTRHPDARIGYRRSTNGDQQIGKKKHVTS